MQFNWDVTNSIKAILLLSLLEKQLISSLETPEQAGLLRPRNINPHPYGNFLDGANTVEKNIAENQFKYFKNIYDQGPVQFPRNNVNTFPHPYEKIALKERNDKLQRFGGEDQQLQPEAYQALARHAKKVLRKPVTPQKPDFYDYQVQNQDRYTAQSKNYAFSYAVQDTQQHSQQQNKDGAVKGSYKVQLPDGRYQVVSYIADDNGYRADVTYNEEIAQQQQIQQQQPPQQRVEYYDPHSKPIHEDQNEGGHPHAVAIAPTVLAVQNAYQQYRPQKAQPKSQQQVFLYDDYPEQYYQNLAPTPTPYYPHNVNVKIQDYSSAPHQYGATATTPAPQHFTVNYGPSVTPAAAVRQIQHPTPNYDVYYQNYGYQQLQPAGGHYNYVASSPISKLSKRSLPSIAQTQRRKVK